LGYFPLTPSRQIRAKTTRTDRSADRLRDPCRTGFRRWRDPRQARAKIAKMPIFSAFPARLERLASTLRGANTARVTTARRDRNQRPRRACRIEQNGRPRPA
jgi:hypothetical protein